MCLACRTLGARVPCSAWTSARFAALAAGAFRAWRKRRVRNSGLRPDEGNGHGMPSATTSSSASARAAAAATAVACADAASAASLAILAGTSLTSSTGVACLKHAAIDGNRGLKAEKRERRASRRSRGASGATASAAGSTAARGHAITSAAATAALPWTSVPAAAPIVRC